MVSTTYCPVANPDLTLYVAIRFVPGPCIGHAKHRTSGVDLPAAFPAGFAVLPLCIVIVISICLWRNSNCAPMKSSSGMLNSINHE